jgi:hypothetical protein
LVQLLPEVQVGVTFPPSGHSIDQVLAVGVNDQFLFLGSAFQSFNGGDELHAVVGGMAVVARNYVPLSIAYRYGGPAPASWVALASAIGKNDGRFLICHYAWSYRVLVGGMLLAANLVHLDFARLVLERGQLSPLLRVAVNALAPDASNQVPQIMVAGAGPQVVTQAEAVAGK